MTQYIKLTTSNTLAYSNDSVLALNEQLSNSIVALNTNVSNSQSREVSLSTAINFNETERAKLSEVILSSSISKETSRATISEVILSSSISTETSRATTKEATLSTSLYNESVRAVALELGLSNTISTEASRALSVETKLSNYFITDIMGGIPYDTLDTLDEIASALNDDKDYITTIFNNISNEVKRASLSEAVLSSTISTTISNSRSTETVLSNTISSESSRATILEKSLSSNISIEATRALSVENSLSNNISIEASEITRNINPKLSSEISRATSTEVSISSNISLVAYNTKFISNDTNDSLIFTSQFKLSFVDPTNTTNTLKNHYIFKRHENTSNVTSDDLIELTNFNIPTHGVWLISCSVGINQIESNNSIWRSERICLSKTSASSGGSTNPTPASFTECAPGFSYHHEGDYDFGTGANNRHNRYRSFSGILTTTGSQTLYLNVALNIDGSKKFYGDIQIFKIA